MIRTRLRAVVLGLALLAVPAMAADRLDIGKREYDASCASCHGMNGKGKGSFAELLHVSMPDLTTMARRNGGVFPITYAYNVIDGREAIKAHGTREMPIWGDVFVWPEEDSPERREQVRRKIGELVEYLKTLQEP